MTVSQSQPSADAGTHIPRSPSEWAPSAATMTKRRDYHAINALGTILATFDSEDLARSWVRRHIERFPSLRVERVTVWVDRQVVYRPRPVPRQSARSAAA